MKYIKLFLGILINFLRAVSLGTALLCVAFLLPNDNIDKHMVGTAETIWDEGVYPALSEGFSSTLDNFTDSLMLLEAADNNDAPALQRALSAFHGNIGEENNPAGMLVRHYLGQESFDRSYEYPRYWHGFLIFLRPLLMFFDLKQIRIINGICQALLVIITCGLMLKKKRDLYVIPWILGYLMLMPIVSAKSLQYSTCFYVFMTGSLVLLLLPKERLSKYGAFVFLNIGIALAYFDFLTYPMVTYGAPMVVYLCLINDSGIVEKIISTVKNGMMWCLGYGGMWTSKWILATIVLKRDIVSDGLSQFSERTSDYAANFHLSKISVILANYREFFRTPVVYIALICILYLIYTIVKNKTYLSGKAWCSVGLYLLVGAAPVVWYCFATNHSAVHTWFTCKACLVSFLAVMFGLIDLAEPPKADEKEVEPDGSNSSTNTVL